MAKKKATRKVPGKLAECGEVGRPHHTERSSDEFWDEAELLLALVEEHDSKGE